MNNWKKWVEKQNYKFYHDNKFANGELAYYRFADKAITDSIKQLRLDITIPNIKTALLMINKLWSTQAEKDKGAIDAYANAIFKHKNDIFEAIDNGNAKIVDSILTKYVKGHNYNVALISKFCCKCNEKAFPISDKYVRDFLMEQNKKHKFYKNFNTNSLHHNYNGLFVKVISNFVKKMGLEEFKYRKLDLAIWTSKKVK